MNVIKPRKPLSLATFLKEASAQGSGLKYSGEKNKLHRIYIPTMTMTDENGETITGIYGEYREIHEWTSNGKFHSAACVKDVFGSCPFCERMNDAWEIYNLRKEKAEQDLKAQGLDDAQVLWQLKGEQDPEKRKQPNAYKGLCSTFNDERKMKESKPYLYMLSAQYELDASNNPVCEKGMPKFALKVMKLTKGRAEKFFNLFVSAGGHIEGNELTIQYTNTDDRAQLIGQSTPAAVFPDYAFIKTYPGLKEQIEAEAAKFDMEALSKTFDELKSLELDACKMLADGEFVKWDAYKAEKAVNPGAVYLEYGSVSVNAPQLEAGSAGMTFALPGQGGGQTPPPAAPAGPAAPTGPAPTAPTPEAPAPSAPAGNFQFKI